MNGWVIAIIILVLLRQQQPATPGQAAAALGTSALNAGLGRLLQGFSTSLNNSLKNLASSSGGGGKGGSSPLSGSSAGAGKSPSGNPSSSTPTDSLENWDTVEVTDTGGTLSQQAAALANDTFSNDPSLDPTNPDTGVIGAPDGLGGVPNLADLTSPDTSNVTLDPNAIDATGYSGIPFVDPSDGGGFVGDGTELTY